MVRTAVMVLIIWLAGQARLHYTVAASMAGSLIGSPWNSQAAVHLFQIHLFCWENTHSFSNCGHFGNRQKALCGACTLPPLSYQLASSNLHQHLARNEVTAIHIWVSQCLSTSPSHKYNQFIIHPPLQRISEVYKGAIPETFM